MPGRFAEDPDISARRLHHAREYLKRRGLAGAVGADEAEDFSLPHFEIDGTNSFDRTIILSQPVDANGGPDRSSGARSLRPGVARSKNLAVGRHAGLGIAEAVLQAELDADHLLDSILLEIGIFRRERGLRIYA